MELIKKNSSLDIFNLLMEKRAKMNRKVFVIPLNEGKLPVFAETIGSNPSQEEIVRPNGYPYYHWIQTVSGQGTIFFQNQQIELLPNNGVLLLPHTPHSYKRDQSSSTEWRTLYITFGGTMVKDFLINLGLYQSTFFHWENKTPISTFIDDVLTTSKKTTDMFSIKASSDVYQFLLILNKYGKTNKSNMKETSNLATLYPLLDWMNSHLSDSNVGLNEMADYLNISKRHLNSLFRKNFHVTPYSYFLNLRIQYSKKLLLEDNSTTIGDIALQVGFRSPSHFVATFRKMVGIPPDQYRYLNGGL
jgi:AraC-like DNA-binding protein